MYCSNPTIILKKNLYRVLDRLGRKAVFCDGTNIIPLGSKLPSPKSVGATYENYKNWSVLTEDGVLIPIFEAIPCGHCLLCADKKAKDWITRASCESATATYPALFVTLTYDNENLPVGGVEKKHVQNFIKRFRENWCRMYGGDRLDLRYFACGEYGTNYGRPHYHLVLWNVPNDQINESPMTQKVFDCVSKSWSEPVSLAKYKSLLPMHQLIFNGRFYKKFGKVEVTVDRGNSSAYCVKYMRKPKDVPARWHNPTFYLSSRRTGGIGMRYLNNIIDSVRAQEPAKTKLLITGHDKEYSLPRSFKDKLFPSLSMIIPAHIRCQLCRFERCFQQLENSIYEDLIYFQRTQLREHYGQAYDFIISAEDMYHRPNELIDANRINIDTLMVAYWQCMDFDPDPDRIDYFIALKDKRAEILQMMEFPEIDVKNVEFNLRKKLRINQLSESF